MSSFIEFTTEMINSNPFIAPLFALLAGVLTSFTPCSLSSVPLVIGYIGKNESRKKSLFLALVFALGSSVTFVVLGIFASTFGNLFKIFGSWWYLVLAFICIMMVFEMWGITSFFKSSNILSKSKKRGYVGAFGTSVLAGLVASPCSTPVLIVILTIASTKNMLMYGAILLFYYSLGHNVLAIVSAVGSSSITKLKKNKNYKLFNDIVNIIFGIIILLIAFYFFYIGI